MLLQWKWFFNNWREQVIVGLLLNQMGHFIWNAGLTPILQGCMVENQVIIQMQQGPDMGILQPVVDSLFIRKVNLFLKFVFQLCKLSMWDLYKPWGPSFLFVGCWLLSWIFYSLTLTVTQPSSAQSLKTTWVVFCWQLTNVSLQGPSTSVWSITSFGRMFIILSEIRMAGPTSWSVTAKVRMLTTSLKVWLLCPSKAIALGCTVGNSLGCFVTQWSYLLFVFYNGT